MTVLHILKLILFIANSLYVLIGEFKESLVRNVQLQGFFFLQLLVHASNYSACKTV